MSTTKDGTEIEPGSPEFYLPGYARRMFESRFGTASGFRLLPTHDATLSASPLPEGRPADEASNN
jgi:hypothetical protein